MLDRLFRRNYSFWFCEELNSRLFLLSDGFRIWVFEFIVLVLFIFVCRDYKGVFDLFYLWLRILF